MSATLDEQNVSYALIGGLALIQHGRVRTTDDIDLLVSLPQISLQGFLGALQSRGFALDPQLCIRQFVDDGVTVVRFESVIVDLLRPVLPVYARVIERARRMSIQGREIPVASPESLIIMKLIALRPQDEADVRDLVTAHGARLDFHFIRSELITVIPAADPRHARFDEWVRQAGFADRLI